MIHASLSSVLALLQVPRADGNIRVHSNTSDVALWAFKCLRTIVTEHSDGQQAAVNAGAPAAILTAIRDHPSVADVALEGCRCLSTVIDEHCRGQQAACDSHAAATMVAVLDHHDDANIAVWCCHILGIIASLLDVGKHAAVSAEAPHAVVRAMLKHTGNAHVAHWGCFALNNISTDHPVGQKAAVDAEGPAAIVEAMRTHPTDADVALWACRALGNIAAFFREGQAAVIRTCAHIAIAVVLGKYTNACVEAGAEKTLLAPPAVRACDRYAACLTSLPRDSRSEAAPVAEAIAQWGFLALARISQLHMTDVEASFSIFIRERIHANSVPEDESSIVGAAPAIRNDTSGSRLALGDGATASRQASIDSFLGTLRWRLPTASVYTAFPSDDFPDGRTHISVGCSADVHFARDIARECGLCPLPLSVVILLSPIVVPSILSNAQCELARSGSALALQVAQDEVRRLLPYVTIEQRWPTGLSDHTTALLSRVSDTRVVVPFDKAAVTQAVVNCVLERMQCPSLVLTVWGSLEIERALPAPSDVLQVICPGISTDIAPRGMFDVLTSEGVMHFLEHLRLRPVATEQPSDELGLASSLGSYFTDGRNQFLLTSAHKIPSHGCEFARSGVSSTSSIFDEHFVYVGHDIPESPWPFFFRRTPISPGVVTGIADVAVFQIHGNYSTGAITKWGSDYANSLFPDVVTSLAATDTDVICPFPRGRGIYRTRGTSDRLVSSVGDAIYRVVLVAQHVSGERIIAGDSGGPCYSAVAGGLQKFPHAFVRSTILSAPFALCANALKDGFDDNLLRDYIREHPESVYGGFTPAAHALAQASSLLTKSLNSSVRLQTLAYTTSPVRSCLCCSVS